jgi:hypothetical protein
MRLLEYVQSRVIPIEQGTKRTGKAGKAVDDQQAAADDLARVQQTNERYFVVYWATLIGTFLVTLVLAIVLRQEMGGLAAVLGAGGLLQGGLLLRLSAEWKEKARIDIVAALTRRLPPQELSVVLREMLGGLRK